MSASISGQFSIDGFDFGVDHTKSSFAVSRSLVHIKIVGSESVIEGLTPLDDHPWSWLIYPPFLYIKGLPCKLEESGDFEHDLTEEEIDEYDIALYAMEHCDVLPCRIVKRGRRLQIAGDVHGIKKRPLAFDCVLELP